MEEGQDKLAFIPLHTQCTRDDSTGSTAQHNTRHTAHVSDTAGVIDIGTYKAARTRTETARGRQGDDGGSRWHAGRSIHHVHSGITVPTLIKAVLAARCSFVPPQRPQLAAWLPFSRTSHSSHSGHRRTAAGGRATPPPVSATAALQGKPQACTSLHKRTAAAIQAANSEFATPNAPTAAAPLSAECVSGHSFSSVSA
eukprot:COSAG02_NODE_939_length_15774_cov_4.701180_7_plen_198_part_00